MGSDNTVNVNIGGTDNANNNDDSNPDDDNNAKPEDNSQNNGSGSSNNPDGNTPEDGNTGDGNGSNDGGSNGGNDTPQSLCELPNDNEENDIFDGIGSKEAYTLGAPNNYIEETSGSDLTGTWVVVSKTKEQQEDYSQVFYSKSVFIIKKDSNGDYQAANCRATASQQPTYKEQWVDGHGNPVKEHCHDYYNKSSNGIKTIQSNAPEGCVIRNEEGEAIGLLDVPTSETDSEIQKVQTETGSVLTPWTTFIPANYIDKNENKTLSLPLPNALDRTEDKQDLVFDIFGSTFSSLVYAASQETKNNRFDNSYEAYKVSNNIAELGTSVVTFDSDTPSSGEPIYCFTQQYKIEKEACGATKTYPIFTVITNKYKYSVNAMQLQNNALAFSKFTEVATKDNTDIWVNTITQSDTTTSFDPNKMKLDEMLLINNDDDSKKITYKFEVNIPNTTSP